MRNFPSGAAQAVPGAGMAAITVLCGIGLALYGLVLALEAGFARWYGAPMPAGEFG